MDDSDYGQDCGSVVLVSRANFDGQLPRDYYVATKMAASVYPYAIYTIFRAGPRVSVQIVPGEMRGLANLMGDFKRSGDEGPESLNVFVGDVDGDGRDDCVGHSNVYFTPYIEAGVLRDPEEWYFTMSGITDFPVPYFWDGEKLSFDKKRAAKFYDRVKDEIASKAGPHAWLLRFAIREFSLKGRLRWYE